LPGGSLSLAERKTKVYDTRFNPLLPVSIERSLKIYKGLVEVSSLLVAITDFKELLSAILDVARRVMNAEASALYLVDANGDLRLALASSNAPLKAELQTELKAELQAEHQAGLEIPLPRAGSLSGWVLENRRSLLVPDAAADSRFSPESDRGMGLATRSVLCAPLLRGTTEIGSLQVVNPLERDAFEAIDLEAFDAFANLAATAIDKVRALDHHAEQARLEQELAMAHQIQASFLPQALPSCENLVFATHYRPAKNVSGDFYDIAEVGRDELFFVIGDVAGRGIPAAMLMAQSLSLLRLIIRPGITPAEALIRWNELLCGRLIAGVFITASVGRITPSTRRVEIANAGHCPPIALRERGDVEELTLESAPPLGLMKEFQPANNCFTLPNGDYLIFYTDGFSESKSPSGELLGREGAFSVLARAFPSASEIIFALTQREEEHRGGRDASDDLTLLTFGFR